MSDSEPAAAARHVPNFPEFVAMVALLMATTAMSIDIMLPALSQIQHDFDTGGANNQQLVVTAYLLGFAAGQLFYGPLSDRLGRKSVLVFGLVLYAVTAFLCMIAGTYEVLLAARFLQGIATASPRIMAMAVVRDVYGGRRMAEVMSFVMMVFIIVPVLAPSIGGGFLLFGSWRLIFAFLGVVSLVTLVWTTIRLPETRPPESREPLSLSWLLQAFRETITTRQTLGYTLAIGTVFGSLAGYINSAEQIFTSTYGAGQWFPVLFGAVAAALVGASFVNGRFVARLGMRRISHGALICFILTAVIHLAIFKLTGEPPLWLFMTLLALDLFFFGCIMPNFNALAMAPMGRIAGTASSFVGAMMTGIGATLGWYVGQQYDGTIGPLVVGLAGLGMGGLVFVLITERGRLFGADHEL